MRELSQDKTRKLLLVGLAEYLQTSLTDQQLVMYATDLEDLSADDLGEAITLLKKDPTVWQGAFPLPAKIRSYLSGDVSAPELIAGKVLEAAARFGYYDPSGARQYLGELGWTVARTYGYANVCLTPSDQIGYCHTHLTKIARGVMDAGRRKPDTARAVEDNSHKAPELQAPAEDRPREEARLRETVVGLANKLRRGEGKGAGD